MNLLRRCTRWLTALLKAAAHLMDEPLFLAGLAAVGGVLLADFASLTHAFLLLAAATVAVAWAIWKKKLPVTPLVMVLLAATFALLHEWHLTDILRSKTEETLAPGSSLPAIVTGLVTDAPIPGIGGDNWQFPLRVQTLTAHQTSWPAEGSLLYVRLTDTTRSPAYGDRISLQGLLQRSAPCRNPGEFDFGTFLFRQGYSAEFSATGADGRWKTMASGEGNPIMAAALRSRDWIGRTVTRGIEDSPDIAATIRTMVLGTREKTPDDIADAFRASGTMHIFSVSGLHVALFAGILWFVLSRTPLSRGWIVTISLVVVIFYVFITGLRPSAWRAALMVGLVLLAPLWNRETNLFNSLGAAALILLACNTQQLFQAGFVLSFGVLLAIALLQKPFENLASWSLGTWNAPDPWLPEELYTNRQKAWYWLRSKLCLSLGVSTASTLGSLPLMIGYFNLITPIGILANLLLVMLSLWILVVACLSLASAAVGLTPLAVIWNNANWALAWASIGIAKFFAALPVGHVRVDPVRLWRGDPCEVTVLALDHGGGAVRIDTPEENQWMIDCGGRRHWNRSVRPHLERAPVNQLDGLFLTHADSFHTGGLESLTTLFRPKSIINPNRSEISSDGLLAGQQYDLGQNVRLEVLFPPRGWRAGITDDRAAVLRLEHRDFRILFMSDAGFLTEKALLASGQDLRADVLVMGRHGSDFCGLPEFIRAVKPGALICTNSRFPESERATATWRERLQAMGITVFDQATTGGVTVRLDNQGLRLRAFMNDLSWQMPPPAPDRWKQLPETRHELIR